MFWQRNGDELIQAGHAHSACKVSVGGTVPKEKEPAPAAKKKGPPTVSVPLTDQTVAVDQEAKLTARILANPPAKVALFPSRGFQMAII